MIKVLILLLLCYAKIAFSVSNNAFIDFLLPLQSLRAEFVQTTYNDNNIAINTKSGTLTFKRPKQLLWRTLIPNEQILLFNNNQLWLLDVEIEQSNQLPLDKIEQSPLYWLITSPKNLANIPNFSHQSTDGIDWYQTSQHSPQYQQLKFGFKNQILHAILLKNALEQTVSVVFNKVSINPDISPKVFAIDLDPSL